MRQCLYRVPKYDDVAIAQQLKKLLYLLEQCPGGKAHSPIYAITHQAGNPNWFTDGLIDLPGTFEGSVTRLVSTNAGTLTAGHRRFSSSTTLSLKSR